MYSLNLSPTNISFHLNLCFIQGKLRINKIAYQLGLGRTPAFDIHINFMSHKRYDKKKDGFTADYIR